MSIHKPARLIIENVLWECAAYFTNLPKEQAEKLTPDMRHDLVVRNMVMALVNQGDAAVLLKMLAAIHGPASFADIGDQMLTVTAGKIEGARLQ